MGSQSSVARDLYERITNTIVAELEKGTAPWLCPWKQGAFAGMPKNGHTGKRYRGVNTMLLMCAAQQQGYRDARWLTFRQANMLGASVRKGERATHVIFYKTLDVQSKDAATGETTGKRIPMLRSYCVFNAEQCTGIETRQTETPASPEIRYKQAQAFADRAGVEIRHGSDVACYSPSGDYVRMPNRSAFESEELYWGTVLHELVHATGHKSRLDRDLTGRFGSEAYAAEELVAEMGSAFLCGALDIEGKLRHPEYLGAWLKILKGDKRAIFKASTLAQAAADFLLSQTPEPADEPEVMSA